MSERKFSIRHSFENVLNMRNGDQLLSPVESHYDIPWRIRIRRQFGNLKVFLDCVIPAGDADWSIDTQTTGRLIRKKGDIEYRSVSISYNKRESYVFYMTHNGNEIVEILNDGNYVFEFTVTVEKTVGLEAPKPEEPETQRSRIFDDEAAKETSDVTLIVKDRKFHVSKMYLAAHSSYFKALFCGKLEEGEKSIIELKDIDPEHLQHFLEFLYAESFIEASTVLGILHLANRFDSKTVVKRCQEFLVQKSKLPMYQKFEAAVKYNLDELKTKCISEMNTVAEIRSIAGAENSAHFDAHVWKKLCTKLLTMVPN